MSEPGTEDAAPSNAELADRVSGVESKLDMILDKLGGKKDDAHAAAEAHTERRLNEPTTVADEIRSQLEAQRAKDEATAGAAADAEWRQGVNQQLSDLTEKTPEPPQRKIERFVWGSR